MYTCIYQKLVLTTTLRVCVSGCQVLQPAEQSRPSSVMGYHQLLDSSLPRVPLAAAQAIQARVTDLVGRALAEVPSPLSSSTSHHPIYHDSVRPVPSRRAGGPLCLHRFRFLAWRRAMAVRGGDGWMQVDEIQAELLPPMPDAYASLANKLHQMVIREDEPHAKKRRTEVIDLTTDDDHDTNHRPRTHTNNADENNNTTTTTTTESMEEEEEEEQAGQGSRPPLRLVRRVSTLVELCIGAPRPSHKPRLT